MNLPFSPRELVGLAVVSMLATNVVGCSGDKVPGGDSDIATDTIADTGDIVEEVADSDASPVAPVLEQVRITGSAATVLAFSLSLETDLATTAEVTVTPSEGEPWLVSTVGDAQTTHDLVIAGLHASTTYSLSIAATGADGGQVVDDSKSITTDPLPETLPPLEVVTSSPDRMAPGFTLFNVFQWLPGAQGPDLETGWLIALDADGRVVWYVQTSGRPEDVRVLSSGNIGYTSGDDGFVEMDALGHVVRRWVATALDDSPPEGAIGVDLDGMHHEVFELPNGNLLTLSPELREIGTDTCPGYGETLNVVGEEVVELDPETGDIVQRASLFDSLDPCRRMDHGFEAGFWDQRYGGVTTQDWIHGNAVVYDAARGLAIVSSRHQDWLIALEWTPGDTAATTHEIAWLLGDEGSAGDYGDHDAFTPTGTPFAWSYHQHAPQVLDNGNILLFDNGNLRPGTDYDADDAEGDADLPYSRAVEYAIDTTAWTISQAWEWIPEVDGVRQYTPYIGDADQLSNGNVLVTVGGLVAPKTEILGDTAVKKSARIVEVARDGSDDVVFDVRLEDEADTDFTGYAVYRSERITGFLR